MRFLKAVTSQQRILGGAAVLALTQFGASLMGLIRDRLLAKTFPGLDTVDVYIAAFRPSDLLFQICIMAGFSVALVPLFARYHAARDGRQMSDLLSGVTAVAAIVFGVIALILGIAFPWVAPLLTQFTGESLALYVNFGRIALLTNFLFVFGNAYGQYLITVQRYWWYGITPMLYTLGTIAGTVLLTPIVGAYGPILGTLMGAVVYVIVRLFAVFARGYHPRFVLWHGDIGAMGILMIPRMLALGALQLELLLFDRVASGLTAGSVTVNAYARNFQAVVVGVTGMALALSAYSLLSQAASQHEWTRFRAYLRKGIISILALTIPGAIALVFLSPVVAWLVHLTRILPLFAVCLTLYAFSIPFESLNHLFTRAYFSMKHTTVPAVLSVLNGITAISIAWGMAARIGVFSIALGFTVGQVVEMLGLLLLFPREARLLRRE